MKRIFITLFMAVAAMSSFAQNSELSEYAGWYKSHNDSICGANINAALDYIKTNKIKHKKNIIVGVLDSGIDTASVALKQVLWTNKKEKADGKDNDKNGYVDDLHGWNFLGTADGSFNMLRAGTEEYREFKRLYPKYKNVKDGDAETNMWPLEYSYYKKMRRKCGVGSYMMFYQYSQQKAITIVKMDSLLHATKNLNPDTLTIGGLYVQEVEDSAWVTCCQEIYVDLMKADPAQTWPEFKKAQAEALKQMAHNLWKIEGEADKRLLIGDDMNNAADRYYGNGKLDIEGYEHGTFVASVIAGKADKEHDAFSGIWPNARVMAVRCSPDGDEYDKDVASSIHYAVDNGAKVINISLGKYLSPDHKMVDDALLYAQKHDVLVIAAAGNNHLNIDTIGYYPQGIDASRKALDNYVRVGGINMLGKLSRVSNYGGKKVDLYAPGEYISGVFPGDKYDFANGTSVAAPVVAGIAAMIRNCFPKLTAAQVKDVLMKTVHKMDDKTISVSGGYIDALAAVKMAHKLTK